MDSEDVMCIYITRMAAHASILAWRIPRTEKPGRLRPWGREESHTAERLTHTHTRTRAHTVEYYSAIKNETVAFAATWMGLEVITLRK